MKGLPAAAVEVEEGADEVPVALLEEEAGTVLVGAVEDEAAPGLNVEEM